MSAIDDRQRHLTAAGHQVIRPPLPPEADRTTFHSDPPLQKRQFHTPEDEAWLAQQHVFEPRAENTIAFEAQPRAWHSIAAKLRDLIRTAEKDVARWREAAEKRRHSTGRRKPPGPITYRSGAAGGSEARFDN